MFCGAQLSLYPMADHFVDIILSGLKNIQDITQVRLETDDLSTTVIGPPSEVFMVAQKLFEGAARTGHHVVLNALFSRGCPGEPDDPICTPCTPEGPEKSVTLADLSTLSPSNLWVSAQFALYPLGTNNYLDIIYQQIDATKQEKTFAKPKHFVTRLEGELVNVFASVYNAFQRAAQEVGHVVIHLTVSANSPTNTTNKM